MKRKPVRPIDHRRQSEGSAIEPAITPPRPGMSMAEFLDWQRQQRSDEARRRDYQEAEKRSRRASAAMETRKIRWENGSYDPWFDR